MIFCAIQLFCSIIASIINFGNSGLMLQLDCMKDSCTATIDFLPEGNGFTSRMKAQKYVKMFCVGLLGLYEFANDRDKILRNRIPVEKIVELSGITNNIFATMIENFLTTNGHKDLVKSRIHSGSEMRIDIDWQKFKDLKPEDNMIVYLKKIKDKSKNVLVG